MVTDSELDIQTRTHIAQSHCELIHQYYLVIMVMEFFFSLITVNQVYQTFEAGMTTLRGLMILGLTKKKKKLRNFH